MAKRVQLPQAICIPGPFDWLWRDSCLGSGSLEL
jgi:hypothetical protein